MAVSNLEQFERTTIRFTYSTKTIELELTSHLTCITNDSGKGKTCFLQRLLDNVLVNDILIESEYPVEIVDLNTIHLALNQEDRRIIIIDEANVLNSKANIIKQVNSSKHLFVCVSRGEVGSLSYPLQGIYDLQIDGDWFTVQKNTKLNVDSVICDNVIVESSKNRSEYCILEPYFTNIVPACGKNNISKLINPEIECSVFIDLGNIGTAYSGLNSIASKKIHFYDYQAFEQLLSEFLGITDIKNFDYQSNERCLESIVTQQTKGTPLQYQHGSKLKDAWNKLGITLFNTKVGKHLYDYLCKKLNKDSMPEKINLF